MICVDLLPYIRTCGNVSGGIANIVIFDPNDVNFTQGAAVDGVLPAYTVIALRTGATGTPMQAISFQKDEAEWKWTQSRKGCSIKYEIEVDFQLAQNSQALTTFLAALDAAACCCGLGVFIKMNDGKIFIAGEKYVNAAEVVGIQLVQDGSTGGSGKLFDDPNVGNIVLKGSYNRSLYEYTGAWSTVTALTAA
jgi:hypothetical protein